MLKIYFVLFMILIQEFSKSTVYFYVYKLFLFNKLTMDMQISYSNKMPDLVNFDYSTYFDSVNNWVYKINKLYQSIRSKTIFDIVPKCLEHVTYWFNFNSDKKLRNQSKIFYTIRYLKSNCNRIKNGLKAAEKKIWSFKKFWEAIAELRSNN